MLDPNRSAGDDHLGGALVFIDEPELIRAIRAVAPNAQFVVLSEGTANAVGASAQSRPAMHLDSKLASLTRREQDVLMRVSTGETNAEIADAMGLARNTIKAYLQSVMRKLGARNRVEALAYARVYGML